MTFKLFNKSLKANSSLFLVGVLITYCNISFGQFKTSAEVPIYTPDNGKVSFFKFSGGETSLEYNIKSWPRLYELTATREPSAVKRSAITVSAGLPNTKKFVDIDEFKLSKQGYVFGLNYVQSFQEIIQLNNNKFKALSSFKGGIEYRMDNFLNYDPLNASADRRKPTTFTLKATYSRYIFNFRNSGSGGFAIAPTFGGTYNPKAYNSDQLKNYAQVPSLIGGNVAVFKEADGKFGTVNNSISTGNFNVSLPVFFDYKVRARMPYFAPIPYYSVAMSELSSPKHYFGIGLGIFTKKVFGDLERGVPVSGVGSLHNVRKFNTPSYINIGVDWYSQNSKFSKPHYFITGTISFD